MSDKVVLTVFGLMIGFVSFAAVGAATSFVMTEVQERTTPHAKPPPAGYALVRTSPVSILR
jgi:hypothetical protein